MPALTTGMTAPPITLPTDTGESFSLDAHRGRPVVIYFYPKADTSGCTIEAQDFSRLQPEFEKIGVTIVGVSADPVKALRKFKTKHGLSIILATDEPKTVLTSLGLWVEKSMYGRTYMGVERTTLLIDREGRIARIWPKVKVEGHAEEVLAAARQLPAS
jgi:peroxiredoxin Q/BCP